jgi:hypothetical protein
VSVRPIRLLTPARPTRRSPRALVRLAIVTVVAGLALLVPVPVAAGVAAPIVFNARQDFQVSPDQANPSGRWSYRQTGPGSLRPLLAEFITDHFAVPGLQTWQGTEVSGGDQDKLPWVGVNTTGSDANPLTVSWPAGALLAHPGTDEAVVIMWQSPKEGLASVRVSLVDRDPNCGDGFGWSIRRTHHRTLAAGSVPNAGSVSANRTGYPLLAGIDVDPGTRIELRLDKGPGDAACDSTQVKLTIRLRPGDF